MSSALAVAGPDTRQMNNVIVETRRIERLISLGKLLIAEFMGLSSLTSLSGIRFLFVRHTVLLCCTWPS
jgi:hypothetical protein